MSLPLRRIALFAAPMMSLFLASCGDEAECQGADLNGVCFVVSKVVPRYFNANTGSVDIFAAECSPGPPPVNEDFAAHSARLTLSAFTIGNNRTNSTRIILQRFDISYRLNPGSDNPALGPAIPGVQASNFGTAQTFEVPVNGTLDADVNLFDLQQKTDYYNTYVANGFPMDPASPTIPANYPSYTATYTVYGADEYGRQVSSTGSAEISIGAYNNCS